MVQAQCPALMAAHRGTHRDWSRKTTEEGGTPLALSAWQQRLPSWNGAAHRFTRGVEFV